ncbi:MAG: PAS domain S-box protein [Pseudomonadales bacterium]|nr:PAS domain S-box protein [Pseudomonadales bacterium]
MTAVSLRQTTTVIVISLVLISGSLSYLSIRNSTLDRLEVNAADEMNDRLSRAQSVLESALRRDDIALVKRYISSFGISAELKRTLLVNAEGLVLASSRIADVAMPITDVLSGQTFWLAQGQAESDHPIVSRALNVPYLVGTIQICDNTDDFRSRDGCGYLIQIEDLAPLRDVALTGLRQQAVVMLAGILLVAGAMIFLFDRLIGRRIRSLLAVTHSPHDSVPSGQQGSDELTSLSANIERLLDRLELDRQRSAENEHLFRQAFENVTVGNIVLDASGRIEMINRRALELFGYQESALVGQNIRILMPPGVAEDHKDLNEKVSTSEAQNRLNRDLEVTGLTTSGEPLPFLLGISRMQLRGQEYFMSTITDLREVKNLEVQLFQAQRMEAVGQLTGGMAHDFNNIMTPILTSAELLLEQAGGDEEQQWLINSIINAVERAASLTHRLLAFSRQQPLILETVDLKNCIGDMQQLLRMTLGESMGLALSLEQDSWPVTLDAVQFESALLNLVINARDAMSQSGVVTIAVSNAAPESLPEQDSASVPESGGYVCVSVCDTGEGMSEDVCRHAFEPFFTTKPVGKGSGLGLSMVYGFVKQSGGQIKIDSVPGEGTKISMYFPRDSVASGHQHDAGVEEPVPASSATILLVEDDARVRDVTLRLLQAEGYQVKWASDGDSALAVIREYPDIDLLFTDVVLPGELNGVMLARSARELRPQLRVLFTSGYSENFLTDEKTGDLEVHLLSKPYRRAQLIATLATVLGN